MRSYLAFLSFLMSVRVTPKKIVSYLTRHCKYNSDTEKFDSPKGVRVSTVQMRIHGYKNLAEYLQEILDLTTDAVKSGSRLVVFPEYVGLLPAMLLPQFGRLLYWFIDGETPESIDDVCLNSKKTTMLAESLQNFIYECYFYTFGTIARLLGVYIAAGSCMVYEQGTLYNRSVIFDPNGRPLSSQNKTTALCFDDALGIRPSSHINVVDTEFGKLAIILGSDAYYFENFRIAADHGAKIIIVPDSRGGVTADIVRCRAEESDVYALYSCFCSAKNKKLRAAILAPFDMTPEHSGTIIQAKDTKSGFVTAELDLEHLEGQRWFASPEFLHGDYIESYFNNVDQKTMRKDCAALYEDVKNRRGAIRTRKRAVTTQTDVDFLEE